jgi:type I restriction enzyme R subunit
LKALRGEPGKDEGKVFNLVRGLQKEIEESDAAPVLQTLKDRAQRILKDMENRNTTGLAAMERKRRLGGAKDSGLAARPFGIYRTLKDDGALPNAGNSALQLAQEAEAENLRFPNARVNDDERRKLRAALYRPLLRLDKSAVGSSMLSWQSFCRRITRLAIAFASAWTTGAVD